MSIEDELTLDSGDYIFGSDQLLTQLINDSFKITVEEETDYPELLEDFRGIIIGLLIEDDVYDLEDDQILFAESVALTEILSTLPDQELITIFVEANILDQALEEFSILLEPI